MGVLRFLWSYKIKNTYLYICSNKMQILRMKTTNYLLSLRFDYVSSNSNTENF